MKKRTLLRSFILAFVVLLLVIGGNASAIDQITLNLPLLVGGSDGLATATTPPPSTTEPPPSTTEPPPSTTEPPPPTTEPPPPTTEPPPPTTEPPPPTTEPPNNPPDVASNPSPYDGAFDRHYEVDLSWIGGDHDGDNVTFDVYFEANDNTPDVLVSDDQSNTSYDPGALGLLDHYFWQIITTDEHGLSTSGPVWDFWTAAPYLDGDINIIDIFYDGEGTNEPDEYVEIRNDSTNPIDLMDWTLSDEANLVFSLYSVIYPDQICRIYTNENHPEWCGFNYGSGSAIWNNTGDTATLRDGIGNLIDEYSYSVSLQTNISDIKQFLELCPTNDPAYSQIIGDFTIRVDDIVVEEFPCTEPISTLPIAQFTDELIQLQAFRTIYYMNPETLDHLPWTSMNLYDWMKSNIAGINIKTEPGQLYCCDVIDGGKYVSSSMQSDSTRDSKRIWRGISSTIAYIAHEVRHADGGGGHTNGCEAFPEPDDPHGCDASYDLNQLGSYGVQYWLNESWMNGYLNIGISCTTSAESYVTWHLNSLNNQFRERFVENVPPILEMPSPPYGGPCYSP